VVFTIVSHCRLMTVIVCCDFHIECISICVYFPFTIVVTCGLRDFVVLQAGGFFFIIVYVGVAVYRPFTLLCMFMYFFLYIYSNARDICRVPRLLSVSRTIGFLRKGGDVRILAWGTRTRTDAPTGTPYIAQR
jgi:hypothetical protein